MVSAIALRGIFILLRLLSPEVRYSQTFTPRTASSLRLDTLRTWIPIHRFFPEVGFIGHVAAESRVVPEHRILQHRLARPDGLEEIPEVGTQIVIIVPLEDQALRSQLLSGFRVVFLMPLCEIDSLQTSRKRAGVVAGREIHPGLRRIADSKLCEFDDTL